MISKSNFIKSLKAEMKRREATQSEVAAGAGLSQAHLSRVLSGALPLTAKCRSKLERWITGEKDAALEDRMRSLLERLQFASPERRKAIGSLLNAFEAILEA